MQSVQPHMITRKTSTSGCGVINEPDEYLSLRKFTLRAVQLPAKRHFLFLQLHEGKDTVLLSRAIGCHVTRPGCYRVDDQWFVYCPYNRDYNQERYGLTPDGKLLITLLRHGFALCYHKDWHNAPFLRSVLSEYFSLYLAESILQDAWWPRTLCVWGEPNSKERAPFLRELKVPTSLWNFDSFRFKYFPDGLPALLDEVTLPLSARDAPSLPRGFSRALSSQSAASSNASAVEKEGRTHTVPCLPVSGPTAPTTAMSVQSLAGLDLRSKSVRRAARSLTERETTAESFDGGAEGFSVTSSSEVSSSRKCEGVGLFREGGGRIRSLKSFQEDLRGYQQDLAQASESLSGELSCHESGGESARHIQYRQVYEMSCLQSARLNSMASTLEDMEKTHWTSSEKQEQSLAALQAELKGFKSTMAARVTKLEDGKFGERLDRHDKEIGSVKTKLTDFQAMLAAQLETLSSHESDIRLLDRRTSALETDMDSFRQGLRDEIERKFNRTDNDIEYVAIGAERAAEKLKGDITQVTAPLAVAVEVNRRSIAANVDAIIELGEGVTNLNDDAAATDQKLLDLGGFMDTGLKMVEKKFELASRKSEAAQEVVNKQLDERSHARFEECIELVKKESERNLKDNERSRGILETALRAYESIKIQLAHSRKVYSTSDQFIFDGSLDWSSVNPTRPDGSSLFTLGELEEIKSTVYSHRVAPAQEQEAAKTPKPVDAMPPKADTLTGGEPNPYLWHLRAKGRSRAEALRYQNSFDL